MGQDFTDFFLLFLMKGQKLNSSFMRQNLLDLFDYLKITFVQDKKIWQDEQDEQDYFIYHHNKFLI